MHRPHFTHVRAWVFDLDNTLYPVEARLFDQIDAHMTAYITEALGVDAAEAATLRHRYWSEYGTTLAGLMTHHAVEPEAFLDRVHRLDLSGLAPDPELRTAIAALPGRKLVYTNGSREHARRVTAARGLDGVFDALYGVEDAGFAPKPRAVAFDRVFARDGLSTREAAMFEDDPRNLEVPHRLGMRTVLVGPQAEQEHVHHWTTDLPGFLSQAV